MKNHDMQGSEKKDIRKQHQRRIDRKEHENQKTNGPKWWIQVGWRPFSVQIQSQKYAQYGISMHNMAKVCHRTIDVPRRSSLLQPRRRSAGLWLLRGRGASRKCRLSTTTAYHSQSRVMRRAFSATDHADSGGAARWMEWVLRLCRCTHTTWQETPGVSHRAHGSRPNGPVVGDSRVAKNLTHIIVLWHCTECKGLAIGDTSCPTQEPAHFEPTCRK